MDSTRRLFIGLVGAGAVTLALGCNKDLQKNTDILLEALEKGDYAAVEKIAGPELKKDMDEEAFLQMSAVYGMLGKLKDKTRTSTGVKNGLSYIDYTLEFEKGDLQLKVRSTEKDRLDGFEFEGDLWKKSVAALLEERAGKLLDAFGTGDKAKVLPLLTSEAKADMEAGKADNVLNIKDLGPRKKLEVVDAEKGIFNAVYETKTLELKISMKGGKVGGFNVSEK